MRYHKLPIHQNIHGALSALFQSSKYADLRRKTNRDGDVKIDEITDTAIDTPMVTLPRMTSPVGRHDMRVMVPLLPCPEWVAAVVCRSGLCRRSCYDRDINIYMMCQNLSYTEKRDDGCASERRRASVRQHGQGGRWTVNSCCD